MQTIIQLLCLTVVSTLGNDLVPMKDVGKFQGRIVGGSEARIGQFAWQVGITSTQQNGERTFCGGSLISSQYILTAAHCTNAATYVTVFLGSLAIHETHQANPSRIDLNSTQWIQHEDFRMGDLRNDIALIKLPEAVPLSAKLKTIALYDRPLHTGTRTTASGWGATADGSFDRSERLKYVNLNTAPQSDCNRAYQTEMHEGVLCITASKKDSVCSGDSGGPVAVDAFSTKPLLIGVVSFGHREGCESGQPVGVTNVEYYKDWIRDNANI